MKKIRFAVIAAAILAAATITTVETIRNTNPLLDANVEALADTEYTVYGHCKKEINACLVICPNCNAQLISVPDLSGPAYDVHGTCPKCKVDF